MRRIGKRRREGTQEMNEKEVDNFKLYKKFFQFLVISSVLFWNIFN